MPDPAVEERAGKPLTVFWPIPPNRHCGASRNPAFLEQDVLKMNRLLFSLPLVGRD
jgi:hypothetical protein